MRAYFHIKNKNVCAIKYRKFTFEEKKIRLNDKYQSLVSLGDAFATKFQPGCTLSGKKNKNQVVPQIMANIAILALSLARSCMV